MKILILADPTVNTQQWMKGLSNYTNSEVINWNFGVGGNKFSRVFRWLKTLFTIKKTIAQINPDILIGYRVTSYGFLAAWSGYKPCIIAAQGETDVWPPNHWTSPFKAFLAKFAIKRASLIHAWGINMTKSLTQLGANQNQLFILPRGIDLKVFRYKDSIPVLVDKKITFCVTRSLEPEYHHLVILNAIKRLVEDNFNIQLYIAGKGSLQSLIEQFVVENNLKDSVSVLGFVNNLELPDLLRKSDFYLSMVDTEGVSASLFEAMACGCFPIVSDLPANQAFIENEKNGFLIPVGSEIELYEKIKLAINSQNLYTSAITYNKQLVEDKADIEKNMNRFILEYKKVIELNKSHVRN